jgi:hypothetical protein
MVAEPAGNGGTRYLPLRMSFLSCPALSCRCWGIIIIWRSKNALGTGCWRLGTREPGPAGRGKSTGYPGNGKACAGPVAGRPVTAAIYHHVPCRNEKSINPSTINHQPCTSPMYIIGPMCDGISHAPLFPYGNMALHGLHPMHIADITVQSSIQRQQTASRRRSSIRATGLPHAWSYSDLTYLTYLPT